MANFVTRPGAIACALVDRSRIPEECIPVSDLPGLRPVGRGRAAHAAGRGDARGGILSSSPAASSVAASEGQPQGVVRRHGNTAAAARLHPRPRRRRAWQSNTCRACQLRAAWWRAKSSRRGSVRRHGGSREQRGSARGAAAGQRQAPRRQPQRREQANPGRRRAREAVNLLWRASTRACCRESPRRHWASGRRFSRASSSGARAATASPSGAPRRSSCATCRLRHASRLRV